MNVKTDHSTIFVEVDRPRRSQMEELVRDLKEKLRLRNEVLRALVDTNQRLARKAAEKRANKDAIVAYLGSELVALDHDLELQNKNLIFTRSEVDEFKKEMSQEEKRGKDEYNRLSQIFDAVKMNMEAKQSSMNQLLSLRDSILDKLRETELQAFTEQQEAHEEVYGKERGDIIKYNRWRIEANSKSRELMEDMLKLNSSQIKQQVTSSIIKLGQLTNRFNDLAIEAAVQLDRAEEATRENNKLKREISIGKQLQETIGKKIHQQGINLKELVERLEKLKDEASITSRYASLSNDLIRDYQSLRSRFKLVRETIDYFANHKKEMGERYQEMERDLQETEEYNAYIQKVLIYGQVYLEGLCRARLASEREDDYEHRRLNLIMHLLTFMLLASKAEAPSEGSVFDFNFGQVPYFYQPGDLGLLQRQEGAATVLTERAVQCTELSAGLGIHLPQYRDVSTQAGHGIINIRFSCLKKGHPCNSRRRLIGKTITTEDLKSFLENIKSTAYIYGQPKTHKPGIPIRPIIAYHMSPIAPLAKFLANFLIPILKDNPTTTSITSIPKFIENIHSLPPLLTAP
ncbi:hypothetical protein LAZ67_4002288 [Cordylochernes scorpioides]|uniref:Uncharacterized protein n=1 Tax=Cordylochernes scorpioides TaxID=51811 RepID=A0ABY6KCN5_9ARAC|nr:hypothetical protein LAZ67_4002288 [Cordylochernes scorpioides]